jgi:hypothetical protein
MNACVKWNSDVSEWRIHITGQVGVHNHEVSEQLYNDYPENRQVTDDAICGTVREMWTSGTPRKGILSYLTRKMINPPSMRDVHNLLAKMRAEKYADNPTVEGRVNQFLRDFCAQRDHVGRVFSDDVGQVKAVTLQTAHMRQMFAQFPEVVLIDATHTRTMPVTSFSRL